MKFFVIGNGFSIDLVKTMEKERLIEENSIDLVNLFSKGNCFHMPSQNGYLEHCVYLLREGVSTNLSNNDAKRLIDKFITSYNVYSKWREISENLAIRMGIGNQYVELYNELLYYLKNLFLYYNSLVSDEVLMELIKNDKVPLIKTIKCAIQKKEYVKIVTYNYDIFLERLLNISQVSYQIYGFGADNGYVTIYKPHGSISFDTSLSLRKYNVWDGLLLKIDQLTLVKELKREFNLCAIIPPYGDANNNKYSWVTAIRKGIEEIHLSNYDEVILFGISYGEIDRPEIDTILLKAKERTPISYINPNPSEQLCFVLKTLFNNYTQYNSMKERNEKNGK